jgi:hypothetical protein
MKSFKQFIAEAKVTDKKHIENYTDLSRPLSRILHQHHKDGTTPPSHIEHEGQHFDLDAMDRITTKSRLSKNTDVYSGVRHDPSKHVDEHGHLHLPAYTSTSEHFHVAHKFATRQAARSDNHETGEKTDGHVIHFHMKKGQHAVDISGKSLEGHEKERLLPRNIKVKIDPTPDTHTERHQGARKIHVWHAHQID